MEEQGVINLQYTTIKHPLPEFIYQDLKPFAKGANLYRPQPQELVKKLSEKHHLPEEMFYLTAGCDQAIQMFALAHGKQALVFTPTYTVYADVEEFGGKLERLYSLDDDRYQIDPKRYDRISLIFLANPNNPAGLTSQDAITELIENNPQAKVVIDEAYGEFADLSVIGLTMKYAHLAVLRSFSKSYAMAGNRIGYIIAQPDVIRSVKDKSQWCNVSYLSVGAALSALNHEEHFAKIREDIHHQRERLFSFLQEAGYLVYPSKINAVLIKFDHSQDADIFVKHLNNHQVVVSWGNGNSNIGLDQTFVRISIGSAEQMERVVEIIKDFKLS